MILNLLSFKRKRKASVISTSGNRKCVFSTQKMVTENAYIFLQGFLQYHNCPALINQQMNLVTSEIYIKWHYHKQFQALSMEITKYQARSRQVTKPNIFMLIKLKSSQSNLFTNTVKNTNQFYWWHCWSPVEISKNKNYFFP